MLLARISLSKRAEVVKIVHNTRLINPPGKKISQPTNADFLKTASLLLV